MHVCGPDSGRTGILAAPLGMGAACMRHENCRTHTTGREIYQKFKLSRYRVTGVCAVLVTVRVGVTRTDRGHVAGAPRHSRSLQDSRAIKSIMLVAPHVVTLVFHRAELYILK